MLHYTLYDTFCNRYISGLLKASPSFFLYLPGHLILVSHLLEIPQDTSLVTFEIAIQLGAICGGISLLKTTHAHFDATKLLVVGFIPTAIIGFWSTHI